MAYVTRRSRAVKCEWDEKTKECDAGVRKCLNHAYDASKESNKYNVTGATFM